MVTTALGLPTKFTQYTHTHPLATWRVYRRLQAAGIEARSHTNTEFYASKPTRPVISYISTFFFCLFPSISVHVLYYITDISAETISNGECKWNVCSLFNGTSCKEEGNWMRSSMKVWPTDERDRVGRGRHDLCNQQHEDGERQKHSDAWRCREREREKMTRYIMTPSRSLLFKVHPRIPPWTLSVTFPWLRPFISSRLPTRLE